MLEDDPLVRPWALLAARPAMAARAADDPGAPTSDAIPAGFVGVHGLPGVARCPLRRAGRPKGGSRRRQPRARVVAYVLRDPLVAALHALHRCADHVVVLELSPRGPRFVAAGIPGPLARAGLTPREIDVLALLLARRTNAEVAAALHLTEATVRSHCRAVLRKLECRDRRELWRLPWSVPAP